MSVMSELDLIKRDLIESTKEDVISFCLVPRERILLGQMNKQLKSEEGVVIFQVREFVLLVNRENHYLCWSDTYGPVRVEKKSLINLMETI